VADNYQIDAELADIVFSRAAEGIAITDAAGQVLNANSAFVRLTGYTLDDVRGRALGILKSDRHPPEFFATMWQQLERSGRWQGRGSGTVTRTAKSIRRGFP